MLSREEQIKLLVKIGFMPSSAEALVAADEEAEHKVLSTRAAKAAAKVSNVDAAIAATWWYYAPEVPNKWKRILDAKQRK